MSDIRLRNISKQFKDADAVRDVTIDIASGEFFSILGPSGCGKTTLLRMIAGFERPSSGRIEIDSNDVTTAPPQSRGVGMVFQNYALFPHMSVFENVAFGLESKGVPKREIRSKVESILDAVHLLGKITMPVPQLSGGEQQRVAVARALVVEPAVLLMDEPLSNLDVALRLKTREEIRSLQRRIGITTIYVTHDQSEAMSLSDRIAVMQGGRVEQIGTPTRVYETPETSFVAEFLGGANVLSGRIVRSEMKFQANTFAVSIPEALLNGWGDVEATLVIKAEAIILSSSAATEEYNAVVKHTEYLGFTTTVIVEMNGVSLRATTLSSGLLKEIRVGEVVGVAFDWSRCLIIPKAQIPE